MAKIKITQARSIIGSSKKQKLIMQAIGLRKIDHSVVREATSSMIGMAEKVSHLVKIEKV